MSLFIEDLRRLLRKGLGNLDESDLPDFEADELLNLSLWSIESQFPFELKEAIYSTNLVENQSIYNLSSISRLDALHSVAVVLNDGSSKKLARMTRSWYDENFRPQTGLPQRYMREGHALTLYPTPGPDEDGLVLRVSVKENIESLIYGEQELTGLPRNWDEIVLYGALVRGHILNQDYDLAAKAQNYQLSLIRSIPTVESKEEVDSRYARLDVLWEEPERR